MDDQSPKDLPADDQPVAGRRGLLKALAVGVPGAAWAAKAVGAPTAPAPAAGNPDGQAAISPSAPRTLQFFNAQEAKTMDAIAARLIPADELGPGAKEAGVTFFIDGQLAGAWGAGSQFYRQGPFEKGTPEQGYQLSFTPAEMFRRGLAALDAAARKQDGKPYAELDEARQDAWLHDLQGGKADFSPLPSDVFFQAVLDATIEGFFSDPLYGGNADMVGWKLVGFPGAYASFSNDIERHGVIWAGKPVSIANARGHTMKPGDQHG
ncbi:gluconate 2-dehydrogenase subunit 3 family protein [Achromobacter sp. LC458]|uniref:gluconate 2-dehydrogenase subunit 3 family protein n=1 Tax=Achromobacter sp. LC458 TaxID=1120623 RepID=UPI00062A4CBC|nr:gluconate 2-dehydrogenase subunit 3 family protein [Achromobacter sp. LC458]TRM53480.1 gluconate 2-dehydrogenase subunit 3 family protein [Achromobacter sp. LC458]